MVVAGAGAGACAGLDVAAFLGRLALRVSVFALVRLITGFRFAAARLAVGGVRLAGFFLAFVEAVFFVRAFVAAFVEDRLVLRLLVAFLAGFAMCLSFLAFPIQSCNRNESSERRSNLRAVFDH